jgi:hypothetical protein
MRSATGATRAKSQRRRDGVSDQAKTVVPRSISLPARAIPRKSPLTIGSRTISPRAR